MASEAEIETLLVRLTGEGSEFQSMMQQSQQSVEHAAKLIEEKTKEIEGFFKGMADKVKGALEVFGAMEWFKESFHAFEDREVALIKLKGAIEGTGRASGPAIEEWKQFAEEIAHTTLIGKGEVLALAKQAEQMDKTGKAAQGLVEDSIGLGAAMDMGAEHAMTLILALERGNVQMLRRVPALRGIKDESILVAKAEQMMTQGMKTAKELSNTTGGSITHLTHEIHSLFMDLGSLVSKGLKPVVEMMRQGVQWFKGLSKETKILALAIPGLSAALFGLHNYFGKISTVVKAISLVFTSWGVTATIVAAGVYYLIERLGGFEKVWGMIKDAAVASWDYIKTKTNEFLTYIKPVTDAAMSFFTELWSTTKELASAAWDWIVDVVVSAKDAIISAFDGLGVSISVNWDQIKEDVQTAFIAMEFSLKNFKQVATMAWTYIELGASQLWDSISKAADVTWSAIALGLSQAIDVTKDAWTSLKAYASGAFAYIAYLWDHVGDHGKSFADIGREAGKAFNDAFAEQSKGAGESDITKALKDDLSKALGTGDSPMTKKLKEDSINQRMILDQNFAEFKQQKLDQFEFADGVDEKAEDEKDKNAKKEERRRQEEYKAISKFDAALSNSAEAQSRIAEQKDRLSEKGGLNDKKSSPIGRVEGSSSGSSDALKKMDESKDLLRNINGGIQKIASRKGAEIAAAELAL